MSVGFVMLVHDQLDRAEQVARYWAERDGPIVIHVDSKVSQAVFNGFQRKLAAFENVSFSKRRRCTWGDWSLVDATIDASTQLLESHHDVSHVYLASGSCIPLRPLSELREFLAVHPDTDFIESVSVNDVLWTQGGLDIERFTLHFPFNWKTQKLLFDQSVKIQRWLGYSRTLPKGIAPHMGSQWWCLTRDTLTGIFGDPDRAKLERFFKTTWIPDESYFQSVVRRHSRKIESMSLTLSKFDFQGTPHKFFDDHLQLLRRSDCFVARKIWHGADKLYESFLSDAVMTKERRPPMPGRIDHLFYSAIQRRVRGRPGLQMSARFVDPTRISERSAAPYSVYCGYDDVFENFARWLAKSTGMRTHGHLFSKERVEFSENATEFAGALSDSAALRDHNPESFLRSLIWNTRGEKQAFMFSPDDRQEIVKFLREDPNAQISLITGGWIVRLFKSKADAKSVRKRAAEWQQREAEFANMLRDIETRARVRILSLSEFLEDPLSVLQFVMEDRQAASTQLTEIPKMKDVTGLGRFLQDLKNEGMNPYLVGDFHSALGLDEVNSDQFGSQVSSS